MSKTTHVDKALELASLASMQFEIFNEYIVDRDDVQADKSLLKLATAAVDAMYAFCRAAENSTAAPKK